MREELLDIACRRIADLDRPAYIKNSDLRYVAVNAAYARFFGRQISDFIGQRNSDLSNNDHDCEDKERRAIVFGTEEVGVCFDPMGGEARRLQIESFSPSDGRPYVLGLFLDETANDGEAGAQTADSPETDVAAADIELIRAQLETAAQPIGIFAEDGRALVANAAFRRQQAGAASGAAAPDAATPRGINETTERSAVMDSLLAESTFDLLDVGICIFDAQDELIYQNAFWKSLYEPFIGEVPIGTSLFAMCTKVFDAWERDFPELVAAKNVDRKSWISRRLLAAAKPHEDWTEQLVSGHWLRSINKRLPNGLLIGLRIDVTETKRQEELLRQQVDQNDLYQTILDDLPVAAFVRDADHRMVYINDAYTSITGLSREHVVGRTEREAYKHGADDFFADNERVLNEGRLFEFENEIVCGTDVARPIISRSNRVVTSRGQSYVVGSMIDISTLKLREKEITEAQQRAEFLHQDLDDILQSVPTGILILDADFRVEYVNNGFFEIWAYPPDAQLVGKSLRELVRMHWQLGLYGDDQRDPETIYEDRLADLTSFGDHGRTEINFGGRTSVILDFRRISNGRKLLSYADVSSVREHEREITEARRELERQGELMEDTTHAMSQGLLIVRDGTVLLASEALPGILRVPPAYLAVGSRWRAVFDYCAERGDYGDDPEAIWAAWQESSAARRPISTIRQVAGEHWVQIDAALSKGDRWIVLATDVTETKLREEELQRLLARSEAADRAKSEFLANMSHEIRTPMNGVLGMAELLVKTELDPRQKTFVDVITKSGNALLTIINDILDFSKIDAGQMSLRRAPFDPAEAIEDVMTLLSSPAADKDIELMIRVSPVVPAMVIGDAGRFRQIVTNLAGNAVKFTEVGHVLVDIDCHKLDNDEIMLTIKVEDTGVGIAAGKLDTIFEKFSQADATSTRRHEGTGLGLTITTGLVDLFGGYIEVQSEEGHGSTFMVHLPFPVAAARALTRHLPVNVKGAHILVIDANEINRQILSEQLANWGFDGMAVGARDEALALLDAAFDMKVPVDAIILDYHAAGLDGADVVRAIRADSRFEAVPMVFLTSMNIAGESGENGAMSGQAHLMKPVRANVLCNTIVDVIRSARNENAAGLRPQAAKVVRKPQLPANGELQAAGDAIDPASSRRGSTLDILVAEDNEVNQIVFTQILQAMGLRFLVVDNGQKAVDAWLQMEPALIMMDVSMPVMNGLEATRAIRGAEEKDGAGSHVVIIGVTAHALESDRAMCLEAGMDDYMSKPISPELLESKVLRWMGDEAAGEVSVR